MNDIQIPDENLEKMWLERDWHRIEEKLASWQEELTIAVYRKDEKRIKDVQKRIVMDIDIKCLAVKHVVSSGAGPGVDRIKWTTNSEFMRAALSLTSRDYKAQPLRQIVMISKNTGKERRAGIPTYYDRAMCTLYGYSLIPVVEAHAERKSFAFRPGRSIQDAREYILKNLKGNDAPEYVVCADIKTFYATINHAWLLEHVPMDKNVLNQFLQCGHVFAGELFPSTGYGISEGSNISPYIGNFVLDGLQKYIYKGLYGEVWPFDFANGNLVRFADDVVVTVRDYETGEKVLSLIREFLFERGLALHPDKSYVCSVYDGFTFLSQKYQKKGDYVYVTPTEKAVERFIAEIAETIEKFKKSQRELIMLVNQKLKGWANYHRYGDAEEAFKKVDIAVQTALLDAAKKKHPKLNTKKLIDRYWYVESDGRHFYALPEDKTVRVIKLEDTVYVRHFKVKTNLNPYLEREYLENRTHSREITNVTGEYKSVWDRQGGICYYCGRPILPDQPRTVVPLKLHKPVGIRNCAYIHKMCEQNEFEIIRTMEDFSFLRPFDVLSVLKELSKDKEDVKLFPENWVHMPLKDFISKSNCASIYLTFANIEKIEGRKLPQSARNLRSWWNPSATSCSIAEAWLSEGYSLADIDLRLEKIRLSRDEGGVSHLTIPPQLINKRIPDNAVFELENFMKYIIKKYGLQT